MFDWTKSWCSLIQAASFFSSGMKTEDKELCLQLILYFESNVLLERHTKKRIKREDGYRTFPGKSICDVKNTHPVLHTAHLWDSFFSKT